MVVDGTVSGEKKKKKKKKTKKKKKKGKRNGATRFQVQPRPVIMLYDNTA